MFSHGFLFSLCILIHKQFLYVLSKGGAEDGRANPLQAPPPSLVHAPASFCVVCSPWISLLFHHLPLGTPFHFILTCNIIGGLFVALFGILPYVDLGFTISLFFYFYLHPVAESYLCIVLIPAGYFWLHLSAVPWILVLSAPFVQFGVRFFFFKFLCCYRASRPSGSHVAADGGSAKPV